MEFKMKMKATVVIFAILGLVAVAQAKYELSCAKSELSIRWPSYESNSEYYVCSRLFGRQMTVTCNPGEVFTFVLQSCTSPNKYIPAPNLEVLPTASPLLGETNQDGYLKPVEILNHPPVLSPFVIDNAVSQLPIKPATYPMIPVAVTDKPKEEDIQPVSIEENVVTVQQPTKPLAPLPPTPPPTPPVVVKDSSKKPTAAAGKKPSAKKKKPSSANSLTLAADSKPSKKPNTASGKRTPGKKNGKQSFKPDKAPKKSAIKPKVATNKKSAKVKKPIAHQ